MCLLLLIQVFIISLDITVIVLDLAGYLKLKVFIHSFVYSIKLELEFVVLNQLIEISRMGVPGIPSISCGVAEMRVEAPKETHMERGSGKCRWSTIQESVVDLEACESHASASTLDFITRPQDVEMK
jgi:hypothetical protein